jgi:hypothetical protein
VRYVPGVIVERLKDNAVGQALADVTRPMRRKLSPLRFKETYIRLALAAHSDPTYVEIGVGHGESLRRVEARRKIGVDPVRNPPLRDLRRGEEFFEMGSDEFFDRHAPQVLDAASVQVALIDGLHEFLQASRDLANLERYMAHDGVVFIDDFNPPSRERAEDAHSGGAWNGDVWKIAPLVARSRPDLTLHTVDADEGLAVVTGFAGPGHMPADALESCKALDYAELEADRAGLLGLIPPERFASLLAGS